MLENMTDFQLRKWLESDIKKRLEKTQLNQTPTPFGEQSRLNHDLWSLYDYGDTVKVVYIKSAPMKADPKKDPLWIDPENPPKLRNYVKTQKPENERFHNSVSRSKSRIFELAMCNEFTHFCTFTQDQTKRDRFDLSEFRKDFAMLVRNLNRTRGEGEKIKYLLIPEQHQNGAWHMHGLLMGLTENDLRKFTLSEKLPEHIRKQISKGIDVFDWTRYRKAFGYFTCTEIGNKVACSKYITKYISKDLQKTVRESGEHLYFASQGLKGRETVVKNSTDPCPVSEWDFENDYVKIVEIPKEGIDLFKKTPK